MASIRTIKFDELVHSYPTNNSRELLTELGGQLPQLIDNIADDSCIRLSMAFNKTGHPIPTSTMWSGIEIKDSDGFKYMINHADMKKYLTKKYGKPRHLKNETSALGLKGIILFEAVESIKDNDHMHFDVWNQKETALVDGDYFNEADNVHIWLLE